MERVMGSESKSRNGGGKGGEAAAKGVPATAKKVVQSMKEIVNCTEQEIYAVLKECDMDPNRAVEMLLAQGGICLVGVIGLEFRFNKMVRFYFQVGAAALILGGKRVVLEIFLLFSYYNKS